MYQWNYVCTAYDYFTQKISVYCNQKLHTYQITVKDKHQNLTANHIRLMRVASNAFERRPGIGMFGSVEIWDRPLDLEELQAYGSCDSTVKGNENNMKNVLAFSPFK